MTSIPVSDKKVNRHIKTGTYIRLFDPWKSPLCTCPLKYSFSPYTGCGHQCLYCYATAYIRNHYNPRPKNRLLEILRREVRELDRRLVISISNSSDPYTPPEEELQLTRDALKLLSKEGFKLLLITKSTLVRRDLDILSRTPSAVMVTITTLNDNIAKILEPGAPPPSDRLDALHEICNKVPCGVRIDPLIPGINWDVNMIGRLIERLAEIGVKHVSTSTYKARYDSLSRLTRAFPDKASMLKELYVNKGERIRGSYYLPRRLRYEMLTTIRNLALKKGIGFSVCREGFSNLNTAPSCDGSYLIS